MAPQPTPAHERVLRRVHKAASGCWEFNGALSARGYGIVQLGRGIGTDKAHRVVYRALVGPIPDGLTLDHLCHNTRCVNPDHLEPVTSSRSPRAENTQRQWRDRRADPGRARREQTHCKRGHEFTPENTRTYNGHRHCRTCRREVHNHTPAARERRREYKRRVRAAGKESA